jgi:hypothetical protein
VPEQIPILVLIVTFVTDLNGESVLVLVRQEASGEPENQPLLIMTPAPAAVAQSRVKQPIL